MTDPKPLLPPAHVVHERLTRNQRERHILRTLLRLIVETDQDAERTPSQAGQQAPGREGGR
jgi:hypothetical protein